MHSCEIRTQFSNEIHCCQLGFLCATFTLLLKYLMSLNAIERFARN